MRSVCKKFFLFNLFFSFLFFLPLIFFPFFFFCKLLKICIFNFTVNIGQISHFQSSPFVAHLVLTF